MRVFLIVVCCELTIKAGLLCYIYAVLSGITACYLFLCFTISTVTSDACSVLNDFNLPLYLNIKMFRGYCKRSIIPFVTKNVTISIFLFCYLNVWSNLNVVGTNVI